MRTGNIRRYALATMLAGCGGGGAEEEAPRVPLQTFKTCKFELVPLGSGQSYIMKCWIRDHCDLAEPCTSSVVPFHPECEPGKSTCTACPTGQLVC